MSLEDRVRALEEESRAAKMHSRITWTILLVGLAFMTVWGAMA